MKINYIKNQIHSPILAKAKETKQNSAPNIEQKDFRNSKFPCLAYFTGRPLVDENSYYIRMKEYCKNKNWANVILEYDDKISSAVKKGADFDIIVFMAMQGVKEAYEQESWFTARKVQPKTYLNPYCVENNHSRGSEYYDVYSKKTPKDGTWSPKPNEEYKDANVCTFRRGSDGSIIVSEGWRPDSTNLELAKKEYNKLISIENPTEDEIHKSIATIHWLIAQESPFERGSDSIANLITKSIYHAYDMETPPIKQGFSFDFEAWYRDLDDFVKIYPKLFTTRPQKVEED